MSVVVLLGCGTHLLLAIPFVLPALVIPAGLVAMTTKDRMRRRRGRA
jgi:hypothetical protein